MVERRLARPVRDDTGPRLSHHFGRQEHRSAPARSQRGKCGLHRDRRADHVDCERLLPVGRGRVGDRHQSVAARRVDEGVEPAESGDRLADHRRARVGVGHVARERHRPGVGAGTDRREQLVPARRHRHPRPTRECALGDGASDSRRRSDDEDPRSADAHTRTLSREVQIPTFSGPATDLKMACTHVRPRGHPALPARVTSWRPTPCALSRTCRPGG